MGKPISFEWVDQISNPWWASVEMTANRKHSYPATLFDHSMWKRVLSNSAEQHQSKNDLWVKIKNWEQKAASGAPGALGTGPHLVFMGTIVDWAEDGEEFDRMRTTMWQIIRECPHLTFQLVTKQPENILKYLPSNWGDGYTNVWLGTSITDMRFAELADHLRQVPAVVRFIRYEPALGPLDDIDLTGIDWVYQSGDCGHGFRSMDIEWARAMRAKCEAENVAYFFRQSANYKSGRGTTLDGEIVRNFPTPRLASTKLTSAGSDNDSGIALLEQSKNSQSSKSQT